MSIIRKHRIDSRALHLSVVTGKWSRICRHSVRSTGILLVEPCLWRVMKTYAIFGNEPDPKYFVDGSRGNLLAEAERTPAEFVRHYAASRVMSEPKTGQELTF
jgi:hypothetical protein